MKQCWGDLCYSCVWCNLCVGTFHVLFPRLIMIFHVIVSDIGNDCNSFVSAFSLRYSWYSVSFISFYLFLFSHSFFCLPLFFFSPHHVFVTNLSSLSFPLLSSAFYSVSVSSCFWQFCCCCFSSSMSLPSSFGIIIMVVTVAIVVLHIFTCRLAIMDCKNR